MAHLSKTLFQSFVKPFYKENAAAFVFVFTMMFCIISKVDGAGLFEYHYSLVTGILTNNVFLLLVLFIWLLYVRKCVAFVSAIILNPHYSFLQVYNQLSKAKRFRLLLMVDIYLLMPVLCYVVFMVFVGIRQQLYLPVLFIAGYLLALCLASAIWHVYRLNNPYAKDHFIWRQWIVKPFLSSFYPVVLVRFVATAQLPVWAGIKIFTCGVLYLIARNNNTTDYDISMPFLFYSFGILANGVLLFRIRVFEETYLSFYRGLPVSLMKRFAQYSLVFFTLFIPELITLAALLPVHLHYPDAIHFTLCGFSLLLLMHSTSFIEDFTMKDYVKILLALFFMECIFLMTIGFTFLWLFLSILSIIVFLKRYYIFERHL